MYFADCKKYSLFLNFTPYFHEQGVNYSFGKTPERALVMIMKMIVLKLLCSDLVLSHVIIVDCIEMRRTKLVP